MLKHLSLLVCMLFVACCSSGPERAAELGRVGKASANLNTRSGPSVVDTIPLTIVAGPVMTRAPLRTGVPFPMGLLRKTNGLRLEDERGNEMEAQFDDIAHWPDGSIESLLVSFMADVGAERTIRLVYGPRVKRASPRQAVRLKKRDGHLVVDTGVLRVVVDERGLLTSVARQVTEAHGPRTRLFALDLFFENALDGQTYLASRANDGDVIVEDRGPIRATIRGKGTLRGPGGRLVQYQLRYSFYAGSDIIDIEASVIDHRLDDVVELHPATFALAGKRWGLKWRAAPSPARYRFGGDVGIHEGPLTRPVALQQKGTWTYDRSSEDGTNKGYTFNYRGIGTGTKAQGWVAADSASGHVQVMVRDFWQQFPAALELDGNRMTVALFDGGADTSAPVQSDDTYRRANSFYFEHTGGAKTYQVRVRLPATTEAADQIAAANDRFQRHRFDVLAPLSWYAASGVFGEFEPASTSGTTGYDAALMHNIYLPSMSTEGGHVPVAVTYGWRDFGDRLRHRTVDVDGVKLPAFYNDTHVGANQFLHEFVRTGDQRYYELGEIATRHFRDIDVWHGPRSGQWETGGLPQPPGEAKVINHNNVDHEGPRMHFGHAHVSGLSDLYLLTGDRRSLDVLAELANWWRFMRPFAFKLPFVFEESYRESERDFGWPLYVMLEWVRVTGDARYHAEASARLAQYLLEWWRTPHEHIGYDPATDTVSSRVLGTNDASQGTGYWTMTLMDNSEDNNGDPVPGANGTNPWMAGPLLSNLLRFLDQDAAFATVGKSASPPRAEMLDMLLQCMNYIVKYGYDAENEWFVYSETTRNDFEGIHDLVYPLVRLDQEYEAALSAGLLPHPEWYDTESMWLPIAQKKYEVSLSMPVGEDNIAWELRGFQDTGWYGYEMVYPFDFFGWMLRVQPDP
jgi:hypothetical protein